MAYVLGYFAADGAMIHNKRGAHFIEFHSTDEILIVQIRDALTSNHRIGVRLPKKDKANHKIAFRLQIGSVAIFNDLVEHGFTQNKSRTLKYPKVPSKYSSDFIRGYFDGDGCVYFKQHFIKARGVSQWIFTSRFTCGSRVFLEKLLAELRRHGVKGGFILTKYQQSGFELVLSHRDSLALYRLMYNTGPDTGLRLPRKYTLFRTAIETLYGRDAAVAQR